MAFSSAFHIALWWRDSVAMQGNTYWDILSQNSVISSLKLSNCQLSFLWLVIKFLNEWTPNIQEEIPQVLAEPENAQGDPRHNRKTSSKRSFYFIHPRNSLNLIISHILKTDEVWLHRMTRPILILNSSRVSHSYKYIVLLALNFLNPFILKYTRSNVNILLQHQDWRHLFSVNY